MASSLPAAVALTITMLVFGPGCDAMSAGFITFMTNQYGAATANAVARPDLCNSNGCFGSFGGGSNSVAQTTAHVPVLIVSDGSSGNGYITSSPIPWAANYTGVANGFYAQNYTANEVYAITWWDGQQLLNEKLNCAATGQIRVAILAIAAYTNQAKVNVIGYCLGNLLARKAILGGNCVDQTLNIGGALTSYVNHYISVGSPNYGSSFCSSHHFSGQPVCNTNNGVICGSAWLNDINNNTNPPGYEGAKVHSIYATNDQLLGDAPACTAASGTCPAPGSPQHTGSVCAQVSSYALAPTGTIDTHYQALIGTDSINDQVAIVMS